MFLLHWVFTAESGLSPGVVHGLSCTMVCGISWTGDGTCVPRIGRQILNYWTTREVLKFLITFEQCTF